MNRLRVLRAERRISQLRLALATGIHPSRVWKLENDLREPTSVERARLSGFFGVSDDRIWGDEEVQ